MTRRTFDIALCLAGMVCALPVLGAAMLAIALEDGFPVFFKQVRVGKGGRRFVLYKLRSMRPNSHGTPVTASGDTRVTRVGWTLRRFKLDELPQLWNVLKGDMSVVGPRPEVPRYVDANLPAWKEVLASNPGITDVATLLYRNEEELLSNAPDVDRFYREEVLPSKLDLNIAYLRSRTLLSDVKLITLTLWYSLAPSQYDAFAVRRAFPGVQKT